MRLLKMAWAEGLEVFLYNDKLNVRRGEGPLTDAGKRFIQKYKDDLTFEIKNLTYGPRINFDAFLEGREGGKN